MLAACAGSSSLLLLLLRAGLAATLRLEKAGATSEQSNQLICVASSLFFDEVELWNHQNSLWNPRSLCLISTRTL